MHKQVDSLEVEPGLTLALYDATGLVRHGTQLSRVGFSRAETVLRYCRYDHATVEYLGLGRTIEISNQIFSKVAEHLGAIVTPHTPGLVPKQGVEDIGKAIPLPRPFENYLLVQEVAIVRPSLNLATRIREKSLFKAKMKAINPYQMTVDGFYWTEGATCQYVFGTTQAERTQGLRPAYHQVDLEYYTSPTARFLVENGLFEEW